MKKLIKMVLAVIFACGIFMVSSNNVEAKEGFDIEKHNVEITVNEDGSIEVIETMDIHYLTDLHGIYVYVPVTYDMTYEINGNQYERSYNFPVTNATVLSEHDWTIEYDDDYVFFQIGSGDYYADEYETYKFSYTIHTYDLDLDGLQMLFLNIISGNWNTDTYEVNFSIVMPKEFDTDNLWFDIPEGVVNESTDSFSLSIIGNTIYGAYTDTLEAGEAITIQLILDEDYFEFIDPNTYGLVVSIVSGVVALVFVVLYFLYGVDKPLPEVVEYQAPVDCSSAEIGVIIDDEVNDEDIISLILDWGRRGYLTIEEVADDLKLTKVAEIETKKEYEKYLFNELFKKDDVVYINDLKYKFSDKIANTKKKLGKYISEDYPARYTKISRILQIVAAICSGLPVLISCWVLGTDVIYREYAVAFGILAAASVIGTAALRINNDNKRFVLTKTQNIFQIIISIFLMAVATILCVVVFVNSRVSVIYAYSVIACTIILVIVARFMKKRTDYGNEILAKVVGLRNFILSADEESLIKLVDDNPYYFYDILPYAYAFGLTDIWNENFRNLTIEPCSWYYSPYYAYDNYHMIQALDSQLTIITRTMTSVDPATGGGSVDPSGGGFSGGGFGGSGGGGW